MGAVFIILISTVVILWALHKCIERECGTKYIDASIRRKE